MTASGPADAEVPEAIRDEGLRLVEKAADARLILRLTGSIAIELYCPRYVELLARLGRRPVRDIDFMAYAPHQRGLEALFEGEGWVEDPVIRQAKEWGVNRLIYAHPVTRHKVDVFLDRLVMSHTIDMRGRLELATPVVPAADLLLSKLQIHEITRNDLLDVIVLLAALPLGDGARGTIEVERLLAFTARDWGFERSISLNLAKVVAALDTLEALPSDDATAVRARIADLEARIEDQPKSRTWRLRAMVGPRVQWYQDVDEVERGA